MKTIIWGIPLDGAAETAVSGDGPAYLSTPQPAVPSSALTNSSVVPSAGSSAGSFCVPEQLVAAVHGMLHLWVEGLTH
ncbi:hypothetical protein ACFV0C_15455 [Streptomyces sp. NPDC059568]|uniref:hypothetical protein n=1 Tax=Streptomyces sp. NPDC059568 TaxID=3346868 RepID=UPI0036B6C2E8